MLKWFGIAAAVIVVAVLIVGGFSGWFGGGSSDGFTLQCTTVQLSKDCHYESAPALPLRFKVDIRPSTIGTDKILTIEESSGAQCWLLDPQDQLTDANFDCKNGTTMPTDGRLLSVRLKNVNDLFTFKVNFVTPTTP